MKLSPALRFLSNQVWAMQPEPFDALAALVQRHADGVRLSAEERAEFFDPEQTKGSEAAMQIVGDTAIIPVRGVIARYADQVNGVCQDHGRSAESMQADLLTAAADPAVARIILRIDSPGGTVAGTAETGEVIRQVSAGGKWITAYVDGLAASAAYWLASQADEIVASSTTAMVGSIGVITAHVDESRALENKGYRVQVFRSVALKAPGSMGEALSGDQMAAIQGRMQALHSVFETAVAAGRGLADADLAKVATGEVFTAARGIELGLVDRIASFADVLGTQSTPAAAAATEQEPSMALDPKKLAALAADHPTHAGLILAEAAKDGASEAGLVAAIAKADSVSKDKALADASVSLKAEQDAHAVTKSALADVNAKHDALSALAAGAPKDPGPAGIEAAKTISRAEFEKNPSAYADALRKGRMSIVD